MQRSMYLSRSRREAITSRAVTSWIALFWTEVRVRAVEIVVAIARKERVVSFPPFYVLAMLMGI